MTEVTASMGNVKDLTFTYRPPDKSIGKLFSLFLIQNICCGYSKDLSQ